MTSRMNINEIKQAIPNRYPILLLDVVEEVVPNERLVAKKNVTYNEPVFQGHFPSLPVLPGVLQVETMAQACGVLIAKSQGEDADMEGILGFLVAVDKAKFRKNVEPGDTMMVYIEALKLKKRTGKFKCEIRVEDEVVSEAELMFVFGAQEDVQ